MKILVEEAGGRLTDFAGRADHLRRLGARHQRPAARADPGPAPALARAVRLEPLRLIRPAPALAAAVASPPYDVVSRTEAAALARDNPHSFLHVGRAEIDLPDEVDPYDPLVYVRARENLAALLGRGALRREPGPALFLYRQVMEGRTQVGVVGGVRIEDYESGAHPQARDHAARQGGRSHPAPAGARCAGRAGAAVYRGRPEIDRLVAETLAGPPLDDFTTADGVAHAVWRVADRGAATDRVRLDPRRLRGRRPPPLGRRGAGRGRAPRGAPRSGGDRASNGCSRCWCPRPSSASCRTTA